MNQEYLICVTKSEMLIPATCVAGLAAGERLDVFLAAGLAAASAAWLSHLRTATIPRIFVTLDPQRPDPALLMRAFHEAFDHLRKKRSPVLLRLAIFLPAEHPSMTIDLNRQGDAELVVGMKKTALNLPGAWLPDHPLPLALPRAGSLTLQIEPKGATRFRVSTDTGLSLGRGHGFFLAFLAVAACACDANWLLAAVLGFSLQTYLLDQQTKRPPNDAHVHRR